MDSPQSESNSDQPTQADTERLLIEARAGDASSLWRLTQSYRPYLKGVVRRTIGAPIATVDDSDVLQRSLVQAVVRFSQFYGRTLQEWQGWLTAIATNEAKNVLRFERQAKRDVQRQRSLNVLEFDIAGGSTPDEQLERRERAESLLQTIARLSAADQEIIQLRNFEALGYDEIACRLSITPETARRRWCDAMKRLKLQVQDER